MRTEEPVAHKLDALVEAVAPGLDRVQGQPQPGHALRKGSVGLPEPGLVVGEDQDIVAVAPCGYCRAVGAVRNL